VLFALQIYGDFSGYSAIARGTSRVLGIDLMENFRQPYFSTSITEFWRRWHISLSTWLRDYLYISLGGNRGTKLRTYRNLMLTMLLGGLWHGASWNFVVWGGIHGVALALDKRLFGKRAPMPADAPYTIRRVLRAVGGWLTTMTVVLFAWIFFRATTYADAIAFVEGIVALRGGWSLAAWSFAGWMTAWVLLIDIPMARSNTQTAMMSWPWPVRGLLYAFFLLLMVVLERSKDATFIYFQF
jgi:alginate O-acetyltransferase complex protein AlgI